MKALVYRGPRDVRVEDVPDPRIEEPTDVLVRITSTNICGSDPHVRRTHRRREREGARSRTWGRWSRWARPCAESRQGTCVRPVQRELRVLQELRERPHGGLPDHERPTRAPHTATRAWVPTTAVKRSTSACPTGFPCLVLPEDARERESDYVMLADIFPTGYEATVRAKVLPGDTVVVYGAGPVGLMAAYSSLCAARLAS